MLIKCSWCQKVKVLVSPDANPNPKPDSLGTKCRPIDHPGHPQGAGGEHHPPVTRPRDGPRRTPVSSGRWDSPSRAEPHKKTAPKRKGVCHLTRASCFDHHLLMMSFQAGRSIHRKTKSHTTPILFVTLRDGLKFRFMFVVIPSE